MMLCKRSNYLFSSTIGRRFHHRHLKNHFSVSSASKVQANVLHHEWVVDGKIVNGIEDHDHEHDPRRTVIFLHGLLGSGKNLRSPAKRLTQQYPNLKALMLDLRGHGQSSASTSASASASATSKNNGNNDNNHTIHNCALDVMETAKALNLTGVDRSPVGIIGHSFGGRCALQYTHALQNSNNSNSDSDSATPTCISHSESANILLAPKCTWLLDTVPGKAHESVSNVIRALTSVDLSSIQSKSDLVKVLTLEQNIDKGIANWMTTNLRKSRSSDGSGSGSGAQFEFMFDLDVAIDVLDDFPKQNFMKMVEDCTTFNTTSTKSTSSNDGKVYLVMAGKNKAWTKDIVGSLQEFDQLELVSLPKAGHWVHVDDLDGLMDAMDQCFIDLHQW